MPVLCVVRYVLEGLDGRLQGLNQIVVEDCVRLEHHCVRTDRRRVSLCARHLSVLVQLFDAL